MLDQRGTPKAEVDCEVVYARRCCFSPVPDVPGMILPGCDGEKATQPKCWLRLV
jgi:hypothetical protein